ncbi:ATP-binding protein [Streptomyces sp. Je 1-79]|uniref:ATP-binding protein n=1 Tax=Streptomyces sp. Je 1-79 TaxID=2943847 RepID=UPI0021A2F0B0|nr:ATP-binding protein [Streptomyces sp. Je 1-79]MCT4352326.1 ATP-binding protein [Streptomyces sp. Je 1-79]
MTTPRTRQEPVTVRVFTQRFSSTPRGARLARLLAVHQFRHWEVPQDTAALLVAELAANAVTHGRVPGRDFELTLAYTPGALLRIDVSDTRSEHRPPAPDALRAPDPLADTGRGLFLVAALASRWEVRPRLPIGKTVRAELDLRTTAPGAASAAPGAASVQTAGSRRSQRLP